MNYFQLFNIPINIVTDKVILAKKYFELQKKYHPDFFTKSTEQEQFEALEQSSNINKAFKILKDEDETIKYILQLKGLLIEDEKYNLPPEFLMEVMDLNENLSKNDTLSIENYNKQLFNDIKIIIDNFNFEKTNNADFLKLKEYYFKKKYIQRILDRLPN